MEHQKMKSKRNNKNTIKIIESIIGLIIVIVVSIFGIDNNLRNEELNVNEVEPNNNISNQMSSNAKLEVYFIDVGQADSILIKNKDDAMLIDAGNNEDGEDVAKFIKTKEITKLKYVIGTHPHEDHIGGLDNVINSDLQIENIMMPKIQTNTKTFEEVLDAISNKGLKVTAPNKGDSFQ